MDAELILEKMKQEVSETEREYLYLRRTDAKNLIDKVTFLENFLAEVLRSKYAKELEQCANSVAV